MLWNVYFGDGKKKIIIEKWYWIRFHFRPQIWIQYFQRWVWGSRFRSNIPIHRFFGMLSWLNLYFPNDLKKTPKWPFTLIYQSMNAQQQQKVELQLNIKCKTHPEVIFRTREVISRSLKGYSAIFWCDKV